MSLLKQSVMVAGARLTDKTLSLVIVLMLSRHFGNEGLGEFNYFFSLTGLFLPLIDMGLGMTLLQRWHDHDDAGRRKLLTQLIVLKLTASGLALVGAMSADYINHPGKPNPWAVCAAFVSLLFNDFSDLLRKPSHARGIVWIEAVFPLLSRITQLSLVICFLNSMANGFQVIYVYAIANSIETLASLYGSKGYLSPSLAGTKLSDFTGILKNGLPFAISGLFVMATLHFDSVLLAHFQGFDDVGLYTAATRILMVLTVLNGGICHALFPRILKAKADGDPGHAGWLVNGTMRGFIILFGSIMLGGIATGPGLMTALYGPKFKDSGLIFQVLSPLILLGALYSLLGQVLEILGEQRRVMRMYAVSAVLNVAGNILLIPKYGMYGSAAATLMSGLYISATLAVAIFKNPHVKMYSDGIGRSVLFLLILSFCYVPLMGMNVYLAVPLGGLIFAVLLVPFRSYWLCNMGRLAGEFWKAKKMS